MKKLLILTLLALMSFSSFARDYTCIIQNYKLELRLDSDWSTLTIRERPLWNILYFTPVDEERGTDGMYELIFRPVGKDELRLTFKSEEVRNENNAIYGLIDGTVEGRVFSQSIKCQKD